MTSKKRMVFGQLMMTVVCIGLGSVVSAADFSDEVQKRYGFEVTPYRVLVDVQFMPNHLLTEQTILDAVEDFETRLGRNAGNAWVTTFRSAKVEGFQTRTTNGRLPNERKEYDKVFEFQVIPQSSGISIVGTEYDVKTETQTESLKRVVVTDRFLAHELTAMTSVLFRPLALVDVEKSGQISLRAKASRIAVPNSDWLALKKEELFTVSRLYRNREGDVKKRYHIPWTFLRITKPNQVDSECETISAFRSPLAGVQRRVETIAIKAVPLLRESELILKKRQLRGEEVKFGSAQVKLTDRYVSGEPVEFHSQLVTNRLGEIRLQRSETPVQYLFVYSGETVLARVPCVPGLFKEMTLVAPDDSVQLKVDGELARMKADLIDQVARQTVLFARARMLAKQGRFELPKNEQKDANSTAAANRTVSGILKQIESLPAKATFDKRLLSIRVSAVEDSLKARDRVGANRIKKQCEEVGQLVERYLSVTKLKELKEYIEEMKKISAEEDGS